MTGRWLFPNPYEKYTTVKLDHLPQGFGVKQKNEDTTKMNMSIY